MRNFPKALRGVLVPVALTGAVCIYVAVRCSLPRGSRPIFGDFRVHYTWDQGITKVEVFRLGTPRELSDPIERFLIPRMARRASWNATAAKMRALEVARGYADADVRVYGDIVPCCAVLVGSVYVTNPDRRPGLVYD